MDKTLSSAPKDEFRLVAFRSDQIRDVWDTYRPLIKRFLDRGSNYTLLDVYCGLLSKQMQLWAWDTDACLVTAIQEDSGQKFCLLLGLAGEGMSVWFQYLPLVEDWARDQGATEMRIYGRPGWARKTGYDIEYCKLVKSL